LNNSQLLDQMHSDEQVLKKLSKSLQGARIKKNILNPNNYIFRQKGQVEDFQAKVETLIVKMISTQEVQADFADFIRHVADTYRKLSKVIIADIVCAKGSYDDQIEIISKLYNIDFKKSLKYLDQWKNHI
jgi:hypothetical protein